MEQIANPAPDHVASAVRPPSRWLLPTVLVVHGLLALIYTQIIPFDRGPDEPHHMLYIEHFEQYGDLPRLTSPRTARDERDGSIAIHPPLYYLACWPLYHQVRHLPWAQRQMVFRFVALALAWVTLLLSYRLFLCVWPDQPSLVTLALVTVALLPEFQLLSAVQNNDGLMMVLSTLLALLILQRIDRNGTVREWALLGALFGAVVMTKATGAALLPVPLLLLAWQARHHHWSSRDLAARAGAFLAMPLVIDTWWFIRNKVLVGHYHPIYRWNGHPLIFDNVVDFLVGGERSWYCLWRFILGAQQSQMGQVDWFLPQNNQPLVVAFAMTQVIYYVFTALEFVALGGLIAWFVRARREAGPLRPQQFALLLAVVSFALLYGALAHFTLFVHPGGFQGGRYLLPGVSSFALLFATGLLSPLPSRLRPWVIAGIVVMMLVWNAGCMANLVGYLNPRYAPGQGIQLDLGWRP